MYKLMIVDDEVAIREGMMRYDWGRWGFEPAACAPNGRRALEEMARTPIDLVITDIRMPGMDGLTLCHEIHTRHPDCVMIILTGHQDFAYAQSAIKAGVLDYLLKPVDMERSADIFVRAKEELDRRTQRRDFLQHAAPIALDTVVGNILHGQTVVDSDVSRALAALNVSLDAPGYSVTCVALPEGGQQHTSLLQKSFADTAGQFFQSFVVSVRHTMFVLNLIQAGSVSDQHQRLLLQANALQKDAKRLLERGVPVYVGVGEVMPVLTQVAKSRQQAAQLVRKSQFADDPQVHTQWQSRHIRAEYPINLERSLIDALLQGDETKSVPLFSDLMRALLLHYYALSDTSFVDLAVTMMRHVDHGLEGQGVSWQTAGVEGDYPAFVSRFHHFHRLRDVLLNKVQAMAVAVAARRSEATPTAFRAIQQAKRYIQDHYDEKITLGDMAGRAYLNSSYFSVLFKKETGQNFIDYLTTVRMEQAKKLLADPDVRIYEIGYQVGYPNPRYFSDSFRKYAGISPQEYRSGLLSDKTPDPGEGLPGRRA